MLGELGSRALVFLLLVLSLCSPAPQIVNQGKNPWGLLLILSPLLRLPLPSFFLSSFMMCSLLVSFFPTLFW